MRWLRYEADGALRYGVLDGDQVEEVSGSPFESYRRIGRRRPLSAVKIAVPVAPPTFYAAGLNYTAHVSEAARLLGRKIELPEKPDVGYRGPAGLIAHGEPIVIPRDATERVQYEGELVAVIGRRAKGLSREEALSCVLGYTIGNDVSERTWQAGDRTLWRAKSADTFNPMGPWIETDARLEEMRTTVRVNGQSRVEFATNEMLFGVADYIAAMSRYVTLHPGDVLWMGTDGPGENIAAGDVVEVEISGVGTLSNPVTREA